MTTSSARWKQSHMTGGLSWENQISLVTLSPNFKCLPRESLISGVTRESRYCSCIHITVSPNLCFRMYVPPALKTETPSCSYLMTELMESTILKILQQGGGGYGLRNLEEPRLDSLCLNYKSNSLWISDQLLFLTEYRRVIHSWMIFILPWRIWQQPLSAW